MANRQQATRVDGGAKPGGSDQGVAPIIRSLGCGLMLALCAPSAAAQLAITEVMSSALSANSSARGIGPGSDFWELTNFGTNSIALAGYLYADSANISNTLVATSDSLTIAPGESVMFVRTRETANETQFREWWGACLPAGTQVRMLPSTPAFDSRVDGLRVYDPAGNLLDTVDFAVARDGVTFVYDTNTGEFGTFGLEGACGTCTASITNDIGSPGTTCGPVPLGILREPADLAVCAGTEAIFSVRAAGLPRPKYQWFFRSVESVESVAIPWGTAATLAITNAGPADAGQYHVVINNGLSVTQSVTVTLTVSTNPSPPVIVSPPVEMACYTGQSARFSVTVCAYPLPSYQWLSNGVAIPGAVSPSLRLPGASLAMSGSEFCVRVANAFGTNSACAWLTVTRKPLLQITEMMPASDTNCTGHRQWFELTNHDTNAWNLFGYRFSDRRTFANAFTITNNLIVEPAESVIFAERTTPEQFARWWGADNLPPGLKVFGYVGLGFAPAPIAGDEGLHLWNAAAEHPDDFIDFKSYAVAEMGVSLTSLCISDPNTFCLFLANSEVAQDGAFRAMECGDIGSPGYTTNPPPRFIGITNDAAGVKLRWRAVEGWSYRLSHKANLADSVWHELDQLTATNSVQTFIDTTAGNAVQRFYRVEEQ